MGVIHPSWCLWLQLKFSPNFGFWPIILAPDMLENQSRALKMWILTWFPKRLEPKSGSLGQVRVAKKMQKHPRL